MMNLKRFSACLVLAVAFCCAFELWRASALSATTQSAHAVTKAVGTKQAHAPPQQQRRKRRLPLPVVQEIDAEGLKKILQRDGSAPRPLLINFWATWCTPCREEFPDLVRIDNDYRARNLDFIIVSLDDPSEIKTTVPRFLQQMRARMPAYLLNATEPNAAINAVDPEWAGGMPATFLLDTSGQVVYKHLGPIKPEELRREIEKVMSEKPVMSNE
jgi:thiol-disulfide isomerase/thioredoxin